MAQFTPLSLSEIVEVVPNRHGDHRGYFSEVWKASDFAAHGIEVAFVQDNQSFSVHAGVLRGLHYQIPPFEQAKLVRVVRGSIFDVVVDIRYGSPTFGDWLGVGVSAEKWNQIYVPAGFAHGFLTLEPNCEVIYKVSAPYAPQHERGIRFDDPDIAIKWPLAGLSPILSDKDLAAPTLAKAEPAFSFKGTE
jgi:dTDP-4-dehydrorhamnose 3,5-epimerase